MLTAPDRRMQRAARKRQNARFSKRCQEIRKQLMPQLDARLQTGGRRLREVNAKPTRTSIRVLSNHPECRVCAICGGTVDPGVMAWGFQLWPLRGNQYARYNPTRGYVHGDCATMAGVRGDA